MSNIIDPNQTMITAKKGWILDETISTWKSRLKRVSPEQEI